MNNLLTKNEQRKIRHARVRAKIVGTALKPRLSVFKSNKYFYASLIDDAKGTTLVAASAKDLAAKEAKIQIKAQLIGGALAKKALAKKIKAVVFDRSGYLYTGQIKALADGARAGGLEF